MSKRWERVTVVGCELVGASFALALKRAGVCVAGWDADPWLRGDQRRLCEDPEGARRGEGLSAARALFGRVRPS